MNSEHFTEAKIEDGKTEQDIQDGLENFIAGLGTDKDKRSAAKFVNRSTQGEAARTELEAMYRTDWISGKTVDIIPNDMTREWREFTDDDLEAAIKEKFEAEEERLGLAQAFCEAHKWARLYGTAFIVMSIDDGKKASEPVDINKLKPGCLKHIKVIDRHRLAPGINIELNPLEANFGFPNTYRMNDTTIDIHHSRVLRFDGIKLPFEEFRRNNYWSDSILHRLYGAIVNFHTATDSSASMIYEANVDVMKVKGLMNYLQTDEGENLLRKRFALAGLLKSFNTMMLLDMDEEHSTKTNSFSGLPDLIDRFFQVLSAATDIPATRFLGVSAAGFSTGDGDIKNYYDNVRSKQNSEYRPKLNYIDKIIARSLNIAEDISLKYDFCSLFQLNEIEIADMRLKDAQRDQIYLDQGVITPSQVAKELKRVDTYSSITDDHIKALEKEEKDASLSHAFNIGGPAVENEESANGEAIEESGSAVS